MTWTLRIGVGTSPLGSKVYLDAPTNNSAAKLRLCKISVKISHISCTFLKYILAFSAGLNKAILNAIHGKYVWDAEVQKYLQLVLITFPENQPPKVCLSQRRGNLQKVAKDVTNPKALDAKLLRRAQLITVSEGNTPRRCTIQTENTELSGGDNLNAIWGKDDEDFVQEEEEDKEDEEPGCQFNVSADKGDHSEERKFKCHCGSAFKTNCEIFFSRRFYGIMKSVLFSLSP